MSSVDVKSARQLADELESKLEGHLFLGGSKPSVEDVEQFNAMLGANNMAFHRWVRNMSSFTRNERQTWGRPVQYD